MFVEKANQNIKMKFFVWKNQTQSLVWPSYMEIDTVFGKFVFRNDIVVHVQLDFLNMSRSYFQKTLSLKCIVVSLNRISATAVQSGGHVGGQGCRCCKNFKTTQLEL